LLGDASSHGGLKLPSEEGRDPVRPAVAIEHRARVVFRQRVGAFPRELLVAGRSLSGCK